MAEEERIERKSYGMFGVLIETNAGIDRTKSEVIRWLRENVDEIGEEDIRAIRVLGTSMGSGRTFKIGTRVKLAEEIIADEGTVVDIPTRPGTPLTLDVHLDNGALRSVHLDEVEVLD